MKPPTLVNHPPETSPPPGNLPVIAPIYQTVKYEFDTVDDTLRMLRGEAPGYFYMRASNPTTRQLELTLAALQGREDCLATASGVNAIAQTLIALTKQGDHILCFVETYGPTRNIIRRLLSRFGVEHTMLSIDDLPGIENVLATRPTRAGDLRKPDQSDHQGGRHRAAGGHSRIATARSRSWTTLLRASTSMVNMRSTCSCTASPSTPRARATSWAAR